MVDGLIVAGMFLLRLGVPLMATLAVGYWLRRLDAKWQAEALARQKAQDPLLQELSDALESLPTQRLCRKTKDYATVIGDLEPGCALLDIPCWVARFRVTGRLPEECYECELFAASLTS
jgi:hypothetical protein